MDSLRVRMFDFGLKRMYFAALCATVESSGIMSRKICYKILPTGAVDHFSSARVFQTIRTTIPDSEIAR